MCYMLPPSAQFLDASVVGEHEVPVVVPANVGSLVGVSFRLLWKKGVREGKRVIKHQVLATLCPFPAESMGECDSFPININSPAAGWLQSIQSNENTIFNPNDALKILGVVSPKNPCQHSIAVLGLCADCGEEVNAESNASTNNFVKVGFIGGASNDDAPIVVSEEYARNLTEGKISNLLKSQKLMLVLDLDNTLVHATGFTPPADMLETEGLMTFPQAERLAGSSKPAVIYYPWINKESEWMDGDDRYIHYSHSDNTIASKKIEVLEANVFIVPTRVYGYGITHVDSRFKLRPGVINFLRESSKFFEMYIYTAGTQQHADAALSLLDPGREFFGNRVFARKVVNAAGIKSLEQILPTDHNMIVVVDDTTEAWSPDVGLFTCYPYFWHQDIGIHFILTESIMSLNIMKERAMKFACNQFSAQHIRDLRTMYVTQDTAIKAIQSVTDTHKADPMPHNTLDHVKAGDLESAAKVPEIDSVSNLAISLPTESESIQNDIWQELDLERALGLKPVTKIIDNDHQLYSLASIFNTMRFIYFSAIDIQKDEGLNEICVPSCKSVLDSMRKQVLRGCVLLYRGHIPPNLFIHTDQHRMGISLGAKFIFTSEVYQPTHYLVEYPGPRLLFKNETDNQIPVVTMHWLECAIVNLQRPDEREFTRSKMEGRRSFWDATTILIHADDSSDRNTSKRRRMDYKTPSQLLPITWKDPQWWIKEYDFDMHAFTSQIVRERANVKRSTIFTEDPTNLEDELLDGLI